MLFINIFLTVAVITTFIFNYQLISDEHLKETADKFKVTTSTLTNDFQLSSLLTAYTIILCSSFMVGFALIERVGLASRYSYAIGIFIAVILAVTLFSYVNRIIIKNIDIRTKIFYKDNDFELYHCSNCNSMMYKYQFDIIKLNRKIKQIDKLEDTDVNILKDKIFNIVSNNKENNSCPKCKTHEMLDLSESANDETEYRILSSVFMKSVNAIDTGDLDSIKNVRKVIDEHNSLLDIKIENKFASVINTNVHWLKYLNEDVD